MLSPGFDNIATWYDALAHLIFGDIRYSAQAHFLNQVPENSRIVIIGGGTGKLIEALTQLHPVGLDITYIEQSEKKIGRAHV